MSIACPSNKDIYDIDLDLDLDPGLEAELSSDSYSDMNFSTASYHLPSSSLFFPSFSQNYIPLHPLTRSSPPLPKARKLFSSAHTRTRGAHPRQEASSSPDRLFSWPLVYPICYAVEALIGPGAYRDEEGVKRYTTARREMALDSGDGGGRSSEALTGP